MSEAVNTHTPSRRRLLAAAPAALALSGAAVAAPAAQNPDAELIRVCQRFAETEFADWYLYVASDDDEIVTHYENRVIDWATLRWIEETSAVTPEGLRAKALAYVAWHRDAFDNPADGSDGQSPLLAALLRDLAGPDRAVIIARLARQHGPLPEGYTADGMWLGRPRA